jgi:hypothetical protein
MELSKCRFYSGGEGMNFSIYSDALCRARYRESISVPFGDARVDVYEIEPAAESHWIVVKQKKVESEGHEYKWFVRNGNRFLEREGTEMSAALKAKIFDKFPSLGPQPGSLVA